MSTRKWLAGAGLVVLAGAAGACGTNADPEATSASTPAVTMTPSPTPSASAASPTATPTDLPAVLTGDRQVTIVRVDAFESGLSLADGGRLTEADDDSGRQLFVPTPLDAETFLIKAYHSSGGGTGTGEPICWRSHNPGNSQPLTVQAADCKADDPRQRFAITAAAGTDGDAQAYQISNSSAYLQYSNRSGLILEELGDAPPPAGFRFNDNGPAPDQN